MNITTVFVKRTHEDLAAGSFAFDVKRIRELVEADCLIVYADTDVGNTFALKNVMVTLTDNDRVQISFDPLTDVHAIPSSVLPQDISSDIATYGMRDDDMVACPRFVIANSASGTDSNLLSLDLNCRQRISQYRDGLCSLTELTFTLYETGISVCDIYANNGRTRKTSALFGQRVTRVLELTKDNGVEVDHLPVLARLYVLL